jgi:hypothetical protein
LRQHGTGNEDRYCREQQLRLWRHQRLAGIPAVLIFLFWTQNAVRFPVVIKLRRSRLLLCALLALHTLAALGICLAEWSESLFWVVPGALLFLLLSGTRAIVNCLRQEARALWLYADGHLALVFADNPQPLPAALRPGILALPWLCVFSWRLLEEAMGDTAPQHARRGALTLLPDSADADALRRLRLWLKLQESGKRT